MDQAFRKITVIVVGFIVHCILIMPINARNDEEPFLHANQEYKHGQYEQARDLYDSINNKGRATWYNLGNCYYHLNNYPKALMCWRRAQRGASAQEYDAIMSNIDAVSKRTGFSGLNKTRITNWFARRISGFSLFVLQLLFLLSWYLAFFLFRRRRQGIPFVGVFLISITWSMLLGVGVGMKYHQQWYPTGIVHREQSGLFAGPNTEYHVLHLLKEADEVCICEEQPGWYKVKAGNVIGWVPVDTIELV